MLKQSSKKRKKERKKIHVSTVLVITELVEIGQFSFFGQKFK
jgi:hypothetical protein